MKNNTLFTAFVLFLAFASQPLLAQKLIAVHHQGTASFFTTLPDAYNAAVNGDTLYIPGGNFDALDLQKSLTLIGEGHHPDSTSATGRTIIYSLDFYPGSDNSFVTGISLTDDLYANGTISGVRVSRCYINGGINFSNATCSNWIISENWINQRNHCYYSCDYFSVVIYSSTLTNSFLSNNVFVGRIGVLYNGDFNQSEVSHNVFLSGYLQANQSQIKNNVFYPSVSINTSNCDWLNNLNNGVNGSDGNNTGSGNYLDNIPLETAFVNYAGGNTFYQNDFHVINSTYLGNDGTPVGIFGGTFPWKVGSLPFNPHLRSKTIASTTNPDGTLHINIVVKAQGN